MSAVLPRPAELDLPHLAERLGLFLIIVLGEAVLQVVSAAAELPWTRGLVGVALGGFVLLAGIWWPMFRYGLIGSGGQMLPVRTAMPLHFLTAAGITALAVGLGGLVAHPVGHAPAADRWLLCGGLAAWGLSGALGAPRAGRTHWLLVAGLPGLAVTVGLGVFGGALSGVALVWLLVAVVTWHVLYGARLERLAGTA
jgi:low temperature requirement protein LtrA